VILRLSDKLSKRIGIRPIESLPMSANPFADWSSHVFTAGRSEYILSTNTSTLYSVVFSAQGIKGEAAFRSNMHAQLRATMMEDGFEFHYKRLVDVEADVLSYSKALSRGVSGSMNDMAELACYSLEVQEKSLEQVTRLLNDTRFSVIGGSGPRDVFRRMSFRG
jgi:hypothetical protein